MTGVWGGGSENESQKKRSECERRWEKIENVIVMMQVMKKFEE